MSRWGFVGFAAVLLSNFASAEPMSLTPPDPDDQKPPMVVAAAQPPQQAPSNLGGGFIEYIFGNGAPPSRRPQQWYGPPPEQSYYRGYGNAAVDTRIDPQRYDGRMDPRFLRQEVAYDGKEAPGRHRYAEPFYLSRPGRGKGDPLRHWRRPPRLYVVRHACDFKKKGMARRTPPDEMLKRQPYLPHFVAAGPNNPLGALSLYIGSTLYRIHGSNEPWTIGTNVSSGCIRMRNADVVDLSERVKVGTKVVVL